MKTPRHQEHQAHEKSDLGVLGVLVLKIFTLHSANFNFNRTYAVPPLSPPASGGKRDHACVGELPPVHGGTEGVLRKSCSKRIFFHRGRRKRGRAAARMLRFQIFEAGILGDKRELHRANRPVALFPDNNFRNALRAL